MLDSPESLALAFTIADMWLSIMVQVQLLWSAWYAIRVWTGNSSLLQSFDTCVILRLTMLYNVFWLSVVDLLFGYKMWAQLSQKSFKHIQTWCTATSVLTIVKILLAIPYIWYLLLDTDFAWFLNIFCFLMLHLLFKFLFIRVVQDLRAEIRKRRAIRKYKYLTTQVPALASLPAPAPLCKVNGNAYHKL